MDGEMMDRRVDNIMIVALEVVEVLLQLEKQHSQELQLEVEMVEMVLDILLQMELLLTMLAVVEEELAL